MTVMEPAEAGFLLDQLAQIDARVEAAEGEGLRARWEFGLKLLTEKANVAEVARTLGKPEKEVEFHNRRRFARRFPTEEGFLYAVKAWPSWSQLLKKGLASDRVAKNAAGAHEGLLTSDSDASGNGWKLLLGDMRDRMREIPDGAVDLIVTDPPYPAEFLPLWDDLAEQSARVLTPGGTLLARCGHLFLPDVLDKLRATLKFGWVYAEPLHGSNVRFQGRKIAVSWQPWVAFSRGPWPSGRLDWHPDTLTESPRTKQRYVWEQKWDVAAELIATFAAPGLDVLDPFAGSGTYGVAALSVGCLWTGIEIDAAGHAAAAERLAAVG